MERKEYRKPVVTSEEVKIGVFGQYSSDPGPIQWLNPWRWIRRWCDCNN